MAADPERNPGHALSQTLSIFDTLALRAERMWQQHVGVDGVSPTLEQTQARAIIHGLAATKLLLSEVLAMSDSVMPATPVSVLHEASPAKTVRTIEDKQHFTSSEAAEYLGVSLSTIRRWTDSGRLAVMRTPGKQRRFTKAGLDFFVESSLQSPAEPR